MRNTYICNSYFLKRIFFCCPIELIGVDPPQIFKRGRKMSLSKFITIQCDATDCDATTALMLCEKGFEGDVEEEMRASEGYSFVDTPFKNHPDLYICQKCLRTLAGDHTG